MLTTQELELFCDEGQKIEVNRHELEVPELSHRSMFYPLGFPTEVRTNCLEILSYAHGLWRKFEKRFDTKPIRVDVHVLEGQSAECPPALAIRYMQPFMIGIADQENYNIANMEQSISQIVITRAAVRHRAYFEHFYLGSAPLCHLAGKFTTPVHAACVAQNGQGVLLCGDSGAGKSSLSYACARAGWTYVTDDGSYLLNGGTERIVIGNCHTVRFRPSAGDLFPEVNGLAITPRVAGKPSIEMATSSLPHMTVSQTAKVEFLVYLNRRGETEPGMVPYRKDVARSSMRQMLSSPPEARAAQHAALERLLAAEVLELRYSDLNWAVDRLERLVQEGR